MEIRTSNRTAFGLLVFVSALAFNTSSLRADAVDDSIRREMEDQHIPGLGLSVVAQTGPAIDAKSENEQPVVLQDRRTRLLDISGSPYERGLAHGTAVCCNTLLQRQPSLNGVPCLFVVRGLLEQRDLESDEAWLKRVPHAVGQNYTLGDPSGALAIECSASSKNRFQPEANVDYTYHTNLAGACLFSFC